VYIRCLKKNKTLDFWSTFDRCKPIFKIILLLRCQGNFVHKWTKDFNFTLRVLLLHIVKVENYSCCRFQWRLRTRDLRIYLMSFFYPIINEFLWLYKIWKQCSNELKLFEVWHGVAKFVVWPWFWTLLRYMHSVLHVSLLVQKWVNHCCDVLQNISPERFRVFLEFHVKQISVDSRRKSSADNLNFHISKGTPARQLRWKSLP